jgi:hypothetical protein
MIRRSLTLWLLMATLAGIGLFLVKGEAQHREEKLRALHREILDTQEAIRVLKAEWSYLNQPERIEELARKYLDLVPLDRVHMRTIDDLPSPVALPTVRPAGLGVPASTALPGSTTVISTTSTGGRQ